MLHMICIPLHPTHTAVFFFSIWVHHFWTLLRCTLLAIQQKHDGYVLHWISFLKIYRLHVIKNFTLRYLHCFEHIFIISPFLSFNVTKGFFWLPGKIRNVQIASNDTHTYSSQVKLTVAWSMLLNNETFTTVDLHSRATAAMKNKILESRLFICPRCNIFSL